MFIQINPEGYTPDGKYAVIPRTLSPAAWKNLCNADVWPVTPKSFQRMLDVLVADSPPPPAEILVDERIDAMETELAFLEEWLNYAADPVGIEYDSNGDPQAVYRSMPDVTEAMASRHRELSEKLTAASNENPRRQTSPAEMLEEAKKKVLMPADMLAKARRALAYVESGNSLYQQDYDDFCAAIDAARRK